MCVCVGGGGGGGKVECYACCSHADPRQQQLQRWAGGLNIGQQENILYYYYYYLRSVGCSQWMING